MLFTLSDKSLRPTDSRNRHPNSMTSTSKDASPSPNTSIPKLVVLAKPAGLGAFVAKDRAQVVEANGLGLVVEAVFQVRAADRSGAFGPQSHEVAAPILKGVGLFFDDVCHLADASDEQAGILEYRRVDPLVAEPLRQLLRSRLQESPVALLVRQNVDCPPRRLK